MNKIFDKILIVDTQTSGINYESKNPAEGYQIVSLALLVTNLRNFKVEDKLYLEIKHNGTSKWDNGAYKIHGLSKENGISEEDASDQIGLFIDKYFDVGNVIVLGGLNPHFSKAFLFQMLEKYGLPLNFHYSTIDAKTIGIIFLNSYTNDDLYKNLDVKKKGNYCNALENAELALKTFKVVTQLWDKAIG